MSVFVRVAGAWVNAVKSTGSQTPPRVQTPPTAVSSLTATAGTDSITLTWAAATDPENNIDHYVVYLNNTAYGSVGLNLTATINNLVPGTNYVVGVQAVDTSNLAGPITSKTVTTGSTVPPPDNIRPTATNTGVRPGVTLTPAGEIVVTQDGAVVSAMDCTRIDVKANNVTIQDCRISYTGTSYGIQVESGYTNTTVRYCTVIVLGDGAGDTSNAGIQTRDHSLVEWCNVSGAGDGIKIWDYSEYRYNYIRMVRPATSKHHLDGMQASGRTEFYVHHNDSQALIADGGNSGIFIQAFTGQYDKPVENVVVENNWLNGGNYTFFTEDGKDTHGWIKNMIARNNILGPDHRYGYRHLEGDIAWMGNLDTAGNLIP